MYTLPSHLSGFRSEYIEFDKNCTEADLKVFVIACLLQIDWLSNQCFVTLGTFPMTFVVVHSIPTLSDFIKRKSFELACLSQLGWQIGSYYQVSQKNRYFIFVRSAIKMVSTPF